MPLKKVTAIVRDTRVARILNQLKTHGVGGASVFRVKGFGEYTNHYAADGLEPYSRIEIITDSARAHDVAQLIVDESHTGLAGDGIVAVSPVETLIRIRDKAQIGRDEHEVPPNQYNMAGE